MFILSHWGGERRAGSQLQGLSQGCFMTMVMIPRRLRLRQRVIYQPREETWMRPLRARLQLLAGGWDEGGRWARDPGRRQTLTMADRREELLHSPVSVSTGQVSA
jgi:hypothetical protein